MIPAYLSGLIIDEAENCPSASACQNRFGSLLRTYKLVGYQPDRDYRYVDINRRLRQQYPDVITMVVARLFKSYDDIVAHCCDAWRKIENQPWRIMSIGRREWADGF